MNFATVGTEVTMSGRGRRLVRERQKYAEHSGSLFGFIMIPIILIVDCNIDLTTELRDNDPASECYQTSLLMNLFNIISFLLSAFQNNLHHTLLASIQINIQISPSHQDNANVCVVTKLSLIDGIKIYTTIHLENNFNSRAKEFNDFLTPILI